MSKFGEDSYRDQDLPFPGDQKQEEAKQVGGEESSAKAATTGVTPEEMARALLTLQQGMGEMRMRFGRPGVRYRSSATFLGIPLLAIARGPDFEKGEMYGHARGIIAIGDVATGVFAIGGLSRGIFALGGMALGCVTLGGCSIGLLLSVGGFSLGGIALGGCAIGGFAAGGMAIGHYAVGGQAIGTHVISPLRQDPAVMQLIETWVPFVKGMAGK